MDAWLIAPVPEMMMSIATGGCWVQRLRERFRSNVVVMIVLPLWIVFMGSSKVTELQNFRPRKGRLARRSFASRRKLSRTLDGRLGLWVRCCGIDGIGLQWPTHRTDDDRGTYQVQSRLRTRVEQYFDVVELPLQPNC